MFILSILHCPSALCEVLYSCDRAQGQTSSLSGTDAGGLVGGGLARSP